MKWYRYIVERNRRANEKDECKDYTGQ
ncbi:uncharacterized protein METZ01_LOCUS232899 [marine metagenome]|uniref:Uncharacterized protein n=1 Tax=marine metagenome TaxID=408172 RepID=A0A382GYX2_9ZZZZ